MTDIELLNMHKALLGASEVVALRAIYNAGYVTAGSITPSLNMPDYSTVQPKPADSVITVLQQHAAQKH